MKALIALLFGICIVAISLYLHVEKKIDLKSASAMFALAILGGLAIANYDVLKRAKGLGFEVETARTEIQEIKSDALKEIRGEVDRHKDAIAVLMRSATDLGDKLEKQKTIAKALLEKAERLESEIEKDQTQLSKVKTRACKSQTGSKRDEQPQEKPRVFWRRGNDGG